MTSYQAYLPSDFNSNVKLLHRKRLMNKIYGIMLLLLIPCMTYAQAAPTKLWGEVKNTSGEAMDFASIVGLILICPTRYSHQHIQVMMANIRLLYVATVTV